MSEILDQFSISRTITIRWCVREDLPKLEWFGWFSGHRETIRKTYESQKREENLMLVAESDGFPIGQAWINLVRKRSESAGVIWALRVLPGFRNAGVGSRLIATAERVLRRRGFDYAEMGVEKDNHRAMNLYERLGYRRSGEELDEIRFIAPDGKPQSKTLDQWLFRKKLRNEVKSEGGVER